ncbi:MAG TPA: hypothetical protein VD790_05740 [Thermoleophilaceae bacterium]|nr:hypothetical protein [Thermoleophilaceae bacterium]
MRFRRKGEPETQLCCPRCKELFPEGTLDCDMCGFSARSELEKVECEPREGVVEQAPVSGSEVPARRES